MEKNDFLPIGKVVGAHGVRGTLRVYSYADGLAIFESGNPVWLIDAMGSPRSYEIRWVQPHKRAVLFCLQTVDSRELAETLIGRKIYVRRSDLPELEEGTHYWFDLIGLSVESADGQYLGRLHSIIPTGSNDVYVVKDSDRDREMLIPALASVVVAIDLEARTMKVDPPDGL